MAARPNSLRTLEYGVRLASNHLDRLEEMIEMTERALEHNRLLSPEEHKGYKTCVQVAKKQRAQFRKVLEIELPDVDTTTTRRKRGRPSNAELEALHAARSGTPVKAKKPKLSTKKQSKTAEATETPVPRKRRGRPKKVAVETVTETMETADTPVPRKRRGRPKKVKAVVETAVASTETPVPRKRRGRKKTVATATTETAPRKRGRPKGSKNKAKTEALAA
jgi:hypothetical protein